MATTRVHRLLAVLVVLLVAGCATPVQKQTSQLRRADFPPRIVLMPLDVELTELTAGGMQEPKSEWTAAAHRNMEAALTTEGKARNVVFVPYAPEKGSPEDREIAQELEHLHRVVGASALVHTYLPGSELPAKQGKFDWSLGPSVAAIARAHDADYAIFFFVRDSYASSGRVAMIVIGAVLGVGIPGGAQVGFASLVDLKTGDIVWFNRLARPVGDLRTPEAASETVKALLAEAPQ